MNQVAPARRLAGFRMLTGAFALVYLVGRFPYFLDLTDLDPGRWDPPGVLGPFAAPPASGLVVAVLLLAVASGAAYTAGWRYRWTGPVFAVALLAVLSYRNGWGHLFHNDNLLVLHVLVVGLAPAADAWSLDARGRPEPVEDVGYGFPLRLAAVITVLTYVVTGVAKLRYAGGDWLAGDTLLHQIAFDNARKKVLGDAYSPLAVDRHRPSGPVPPDGRADPGRRAGRADRPAGAPLGGVVVGVGMAVPRRDRGPDVDLLRLPTELHRLRPVLPDRGPRRAGPGAVAGS